MKDTVIVLTHTKIDYDSRIRRQITQLSKEFDIILCSQLGEESRREGLPDNIHYIFYNYFTTAIGYRLFEVYLSKDTEKIQRLEEINHQLNLGLDELRAYETYRCDFASLVKNTINYLKYSDINVRAILVNDIAVLPIAYRMRNILRHNYPDIKFIGDMHELHFNYSHLANQFSQDVMLWCVDNYLYKCDMVSTVVDYVARLYSDRYKKVPVMTIRNVAEYNELSPSYNENVIRLVYVGAVQEARRIDKMIMCMQYLANNYTLDLYLLNNTLPQQEDIKKLNQLIVELNLYDRVKIVEPVDSNILIKHINQYDIGIYYIKPLVANHQNCLPNKLFEFIQARLAVVMTPIPTIKEVIEKYDVGLVPEDYLEENFVEKIRLVGENLEYYKNQSDKAAHVLNSEQEWMKLVKYIRQGYLEPDQYIKGYVISE